VFLWVLRDADIYLSYFDGGFIRGTALRRLELPLLRFAGKRIIVSPYGSDIAVPAISALPSSGSSKTIRRSPRTASASDNVYSSSRAGPISYPQLPVRIHAALDILWTTQSRSTPTTGRLNLNRATPTDTTGRSS